MVTRGVSEPVKDGVVENAPVGLSVPVGLKETADERVADTGPTVAV